MAWLCLFPSNGICKREASQVQCPTLLVHGAKDAMVPPEHPGYFKQHIPNVRSAPVLPTPAIVAAVAMLSAFKVAWPSVDEPVSMWMIVFYD